MMRAANAAPCRRTWRGLAVVLAGLAAGADIVRADDLPVLDAVVVTGSRYERPTFNLPASVDVLDASRIAEGQAGVNVTEALAAVPGVVAANRQNYAQDVQVSARGFGARSAFGIRGVRLLADGIPATLADGQGQAATFDLDAAARIEVLRGPFAAVYGNHSGGVIQLFSRDGEGPPRGTAQFLAGSWNSRKLDTTAEGRSGALSYLVDASRFDTDGYRAHSAATRDQSFVKLATAPDGDSRLTLVAGTLHQAATQDPQGLSWAQAKSDPRSAAAAALAFDTRKSIDHMQGGILWEREVGQGRIEAMAYGGTRGVVQYLSVPLAAQTASAANSGGVVDFDRRFGGAGLRWLRRIAFDGGARLSTTAGMDWDVYTDDRRGYENFVGTTLGVKGRLRRNEADTVRSLSPYLQAEWTLAPWSVTLGVRHSDVRFAVADKFLANGDDGGHLRYTATTPMAGIVYALSPSLNLYASAARGFETPTLNELFYSAGGSGFNLGLKSTASRHAELGIKALPGSDTRVDLAMFAVASRDELVVDQSLGGRTSYRNAGATRRNGIELTVDTRLGRGFSARLALATLRAVYTEDFATRIGVGGALVPTRIAAGARLPGTPDRSGFAELAWRSAADGWTAAIELAGRGRTMVEDSNAFAPAPGYGVANLRLGRSVDAGEWTLGGFVRVDNLFDRGYIGSVIVGDGNNRYYEPAPRRSGLLGMEVKRPF